MLTIRANPGPLYFGRGSFLPHGSVRVHDLSYSRRMRMNPRELLSTDTYAARLVVGFKVGDRPTYNIDDLVEIVTAFRKAQGKPDASFISQKGVYQHRSSREIVVEDSGQVIIDVWGTPPDEFLDEMTMLAEHVATTMQQESVILEIQRNGVTQQVFSVMP